MSDELTIKPIPCLLAPLGRRQSWEGERGDGKVFLRSYLSSHCPALALLVINSINISNSSCP